MRTLVAVLLLAAWVVSGCARNKAGASFSDGAGGRGVAGTPAAQGSPTSPKAIVTPTEVLVGKVVRVNPNGRFVVLNFPVGRLPAVEQSLALYRAGLKTGEVRITGPQLDDNIVADLLTGDAEVGDEARDK